MAGMTTALTVFAENGNARTNTYTGHTALKPKLVLEKKRPIEGNNSVAEYRAIILAATVDANGLVLPSKVSFDVTVRYPALGQSSDITAALAILRDIIASDDFANSVTTLNWL